MPPIVKIQKCIYGLKQASFKWRLLLDTTLKSLGFIRLQTAKYICKVEKSFSGFSERLILGVYVDDILCLGTSSDVTYWFYQLISNLFSITINLQISLFLGMQIDHYLANKIITISQPGYVDTLLDRFHIDQKLSKFRLYPIYSFH